MNKLLVWQPAPAISFAISLRFVVATVTLVTALLVTSFIGIQIGSSSIPAGDLWAALTQPLDLLGDDALTAYHFRIPRIVGGIFCGMLMAGAGYLLQVVSRNGLADAGILGISEGAVAAVVIAILLFGIVPREWLSLISVVGAFSTALLVLALGRRLMASGGIILIGIAINIVLGAVVEVIVISGGIEQFASMLIWSRGTLATIARGDMDFLVWAGLPLIALLVVSSRHLSPFALGDEQARAMGHNTRLLTPYFMLLAAALLAPVVATAGPISFLGLMSSYFARRFVGDRPAEVLITALLTGALLFLLADSIGRSLFYPAIIPAGILVSVVGVPAFLIAARLSRGRA